ncbi:hypothetical protein HLPCO_003191, partial [Haloplasma contractile SSD-17B]
EGTAITHTVQLKGKIILLSISNHTVENYMNHKIKIPSISKNRGIFICT